MTDPGHTIPAAPDAAEEAAWAGVRARWGDPLAHRAYLDRCLALESLARAGARYRDVLAEVPGDPVAAAGRDEVVRRATLVGLSALPRSAQPPPWFVGRERPWVKWALFALVAGPLLLAAVRLLGGLAGVGR